MKNQKITPSCFLGKELIRRQNSQGILTIVTAGSRYIDIDAYACAVAMAELLSLKGENAFAYSIADANYSVCPSLMENSQLLRTLPSNFHDQETSYIIVDVSDPDYIKDVVPLDRVAAVYDHHVGFESYWAERIGDSAHIEFIGAAATLIYREWKLCGLQDSMSPYTARLLIAAILDNTLNLTSSNTTQEDKDVFDALCKQYDVGYDWCANYFTEVQKAVEADLKNALMGDLKIFSESTFLPQQIAQLCVWDANHVLARLPEIRSWFYGGNSWMLNIISLREQKSYFVCDDTSYQKDISKVFDVYFENGVAISTVAYLRKEIIKKMCYTTYNLK